MGGSISAFVQSLTVTTRLSDLPDKQKGVIVAMRITILARVEKQGPKSHLIQQLGDEVAATHFAHIVEMMGDCWPEPMVVNRPCGSMVTYDEMLLLDLVKATVQKVPQRFNELLSEMIGRSDRRKLSLVFAKFADRLMR